MFDFESKDTGSIPVAATKEWFQQIKQSNFYFESNMPFCFWEYRQGTGRVCKTSPWWFDSICSHTSCKWSARNKIHRMIRVKNHQSVSLKVDGHQTVNLAHKKLRGFESLHSHICRSPIEVDWAWFVIKIRKCIGGSNPSFGSNIGWFIDHEEGLIVGHFKPTRPCSCSLSGRILAL